MHGNVVWKVMFKLKCLKVALRSWNKGDFGNNNLQIDSTKAMVGVIQNKIELEGFSESTFQEKVEAHLMIILHEHYYRKGF